MSDNLNPRQFSNYTVRPDRTWPGVVEAVHNDSGRRIGQLSWLSEHHRWNGNQRELAPPEIYKVGVHKRYRRKGIASAMLAAAREIEPGLQHSHALTDDGRAWAEKTP